MAHDRRTRTPRPGDILWKGKVGETEWTVTCLAVHSPSTDGEPDDDGVTTAGDPYWILAFETTIGERSEHRWFPQSRVLQGTLPNWTKHLVGQLKRALIHFKTNTASS